MESCVCTGIWYCKHCKDNWDMRLNLYAVDPNKELKATVIYDYKDLSSYQDIEFSGLSIFEDFIDSEEE